MIVDQDSSRFSKKRRTLLALSIAGLASGLSAFASRAQNAPLRQPDVPYEPSPQYVVDKMLALAQVNKDDVLYDLGCGDGRIVITAAEKYGARGVGIDIDPQRIAEARANAKKAGVENRVQFVVGDLYASDFSKATVVTLFLWPHVNLKLRPLLWQQLKIGTRVVSHLWDMGPEWPPEKTETIRGKKIYYWTITAAQKKAA
ncbi:MAG TPA: class I SAM-dependent methyltransferase [Noviherbaspirillum sp.]|nr:class I SAM-dependent methyltransferase [Noviherbaspirillum sp.]